MDHKDIREVDGIESACVSAETAYSYGEEGSCVRLVVNAHQWPQQSAWLPAAAARLLARHLLELADEADLQNLEDQDVEMACTTCGKPVRRAFGSSSWAHRDPDGVLGCTASPVRARVAARA